VQDLILKEAYTRLAVVGVLVLFLYFTGYSFFSFLLLLLLGFLLFIYRKPKAIIRPVKNSIYSVVYGTISTIETKDDFIEIVIEKSFLDLSSIFSPIDSKIEDVISTKGLSTSLIFSNAKKLNSTLSFTLSYNKKQIFVEVISGFLNSNILFDFAKNDEIKSMQKIGLLLNGMVIMRVPKSLKLKVEVGDKLSPSLNIVGV
jgi:phosphatidylserine decarboxylase